MGTHGQAGRETREALEAHKPFKRSGFAMSAVAGAASTSGQLPEPYRAEYWAATRAGNVAYTVLSYQTPIAWVLTDGTVVVPSVKYSRTTSNHQGMLYLLRARVSP